MQYAKISAVLALSSVAFPPREADAQIVHYGSRVTLSQEPVTNAALDAKIQRRAAQYRRYAPVPRVAFFDVAFPADSVEYLAMHGYALLVVTAIDQDSSELPPARVYVTSAAVARNFPSYPSARPLCRTQACARRLGVGASMRYTCYQSPCGSRVDNCFLTLRRIGRRSPSVSSIRPFHQTCSA